MNTNDYSKEFIKEYGINKVTLNTLEEVITKLGYTLIKYNSVFNNEYVDKLVKGLMIKDNLENNPCFTYKTDYMSYIFVREGMQEQVLLPLLLHEIGHIYLKHMDSSLTDDPVTLECEANEFAFKVQYYVNQNRLKRKALYIVPAFLLSVLVITAIVQYHQQTQETAEIITETTSEAAVTETTTDHNENSEMLYYVTPSGKKISLRGLSSYQS